MKQWEIRDVTVPADVTRTRHLKPEPSASLRILVDQFPAVFWTTDSDLRFTASLGAGLAAFGLGPNQLVGTRIDEFVEGDDNAEAVEAHRRALEGSTVAFSLTWHGHAIDCRVAPLVDGTGAVIGTICVALPGHAVVGAQLAASA